MCTIKKIKKIKRLGLMLCALGVVSGLEIRGMNEEEEKNEMPPIILGINMSGDHENGIYLLALNTDPLKLPTKELLKAKLGEQEFNSRSKILMNTKNEKIIVISSNEGYDKGTLNGDKSIWTDDVYNWYKVGKMEYEYDGSSKVTLKISPCEEIKKVKNLEKHLGKLNNIECEIDLSPLKTTINMKENKNKCKEYISENKNEVRIEDPNNDLNNSNIEEEEEWTVPPVFDLGGENNGVEVVSLLVIAKKNPNEMGDVQLISQEYLNEYIIKSNAFEKTKNKSFEYWRHVTNIKDSSFDYKKEFVEETKENLEKNYYFFTWYPVGKLEGTYGKYTLKIDINEESNIAKYCSQKIELVKQLDKFNGHEDLEKQKESLEEKKKQKEKERLEKERLEKEKQEKLKNEKLEKEKLEKEKLEKERLEKEKKEQEMLEKEQRETTTQLITAALWGTFVGIVENFSKPFMKKHAPLNQPVISTAAYYGLAGFGPFAITKQKSPVSTVIAGCGGRFLGNFVGSYAKKFYKQVTGLTRGI